MATRKESVEYVNLEQPKLIGLDIDGSIKNFAGAIGNVAALLKLQKEKQAIVLNAIEQAKAAALEIKKLDRYFLKDLMEKKTEHKKNLEDSEKINYNEALKNLQRNIAELSKDLHV